MSVSAAAINHLAAETPSTEAAQPEEAAISLIEDDSHGATPHSPARTGPPLPHTGPTAHALLQDT